jgi:xylan 1,4-beta-xylosidase
VRRPRVVQYRIDADHANSYEAWKRMGEPQPPAPAQVAALMKAGTLQPSEPARSVDAQAGRVSLSLPLPRQGVALIELTW